MDSTFANNVSGIQTLVYSGALPLSSAGGSFDVLLTLQNSFAYDPNLGNLLMEIRNFTGGNTSQFLFVVGSDPDASSTQRVFSFDNSATGLTGNISGNSGLATRFEFNNLGGGAPEMDASSAITPLVACLVLLGLARRRAGRPHPVF